MVHQPVTGAVGSFDFRTAGRVVFGPGRSAELPALIRGWGSRALVCTGADPGRHRELLDALPLPVSVFPVVGEPTVEVARGAALMARSVGADVVIGLGGGSVLDVGKTVAMLLGNGGDPLDYLEVIGRGLPISAPSAPYIAVPTTAGTGSEVTENAVLASPADGRKASLRSASMVPRIAIVDPLLTLGCSPAVTAASGLDALTQCLEPLVSAMANPMADALAAEGLRRSSAGIRRAFLDGSDVEARTHMSLAALLGGMSLANSKLGAVHGFAGVIGGMVDSAHGAVCAALLAPVARVNLRALHEREPHNPAVQKYRQAAALLTGEPSATAADGIDWISDTVAALGIKGLAELGVRPDLMDEIVSKTATASSTKGNPIVLTAGELRDVLNMSMG